MDIFTLYGRISINGDAAISALKKVSSAATACGKAVEKGIAVGAGALGVLATASVKTYADYEQLVGGVETLFKESSNQIMRYASNAYKTAGLSANEYMSTVTSFSASLLQGLGGDTEAAAKIANTAIVDMSDNANKMGTDMSMIQNAYQGFAKQNYTMLDNLKLGYGGTQAEMARLINDSGVLGNTIEVTAETVNSVSFDKIIEAIHVVQKQMGITGTTAKEASETISGSISTMKSAWTNLTIGIADNDQDIDNLLDKFVDSVETVVRNIMKRVPHIKRNLKRLIQELGTQVLSYVRDWWDNGNVVLSIIKDTARWVLPMFDMPYDHDVQKAINDWWNNTLLPATENMGSFWSDLLLAMDSVRVWIEENKGVVIAFFGALTIALGIVNAPLLIIGAVLLLVAANWELLKTAVNLAWEAIKQFFGETIPEAWNSMVEGIKTWWNDHVTTPINDSITAIGRFFSEQIPAAWNQFVDDIKAKWNEVTEWIDNSATAVLSFFGVEMPADWSLTKSIVEAWNNVISAINSAIEAVQQFFGISGGSEVFSDHSAYKGGYGQSVDYGMGGAGGGTSAVAFDNGTPFSNSKVRGFATGLDYVPKNNFLARLHHREAVLTAEEADEWRKGKSTGGIDYDQLAEAMSNRPIAINIDGKAFATIMAKEMSRSIGNRNIQTLMGMGG